jgi:hypothetical protein
MSQNKEFLRPSVASVIYQELFSNYLKEEVEIEPLYELQNSIDVVFGKNEECKAYKLYYALTKSNYDCRELRVYQSPVNSNYYLTVTYNTNITGYENISDTQN